MQLPASLGSYEQLLAALLHDPLLGSTRPNWPFRHIESLQPIPTPWRDGGAEARVDAAVAYIVNLLTVKEAAAQLKGGLAQHVVQQIDSALARFVEDYCGTLPHHFPWPGPASNPAIAPLVSQLALLANTLQQGSLRADLLTTAGRILEKGIVQGQGAAGGPRQTPG